MDIYKKLFKYVPDKKYLVYIGIFMSLISSVLSILPYWFLYKFLNEFLLKKDFTQAKNYAITIFVIMLVQSLIYFISVGFTHLFAFRLETNLRKAGISHLMKASFSFFDVNESGRIRKIIDDNATDTHMIVAHLIPDITVALITPILLFVIMFSVDIYLGIATVILTILSAIFTKLMYGDVKFMEKYNKALERVNSEAVEYVRGMQVLKIFKASIFSFKSFYDSIVDYSRCAYEYSKSCKQPYVIFQIILLGAAAFVTPFAIMLSKGAENNVSIMIKLIFFTCFIGTLFGCFMRIMYVGMHQYMATQAVEKLENLFTEMEANDIKYGNDKEFSSYDIEFRNVSFKYDTANILENLSFRLDENKTYALVGSSGGGKSTIAKLISGFYKIDEGEILIGGKNISTYSREALMNNISFVFQNSKLFKTTIFENVKIGNENASYEEVMNALKLARCGDILDKFETRENTVIGSKGVHLSGGEIQRIAIARAILKDAKIIILDEASAASDPENEHEIQLAFSNLMKDKTVIMIAHRLSSIRNVDEILVVDNGKIIERGTDKELMEIGGRYKFLQDLFSQANEWRI
ncbi:MULTISPECIES: ABC transporter ATP-binding protein [unclassified Parvimonas]|uniref:ABC transporter ATP-binding protein n=1 Tax=unclassified Parvimonas TaxID=1151464 RepID=UPI002B46B066|nr:MULTISPECIES: ABC transporter ATP-binding protein [unclassified Parvimonas]MEB3024316.1 ABC transporter ATP-binding protein [Parvimonas sp. M13]MEB3088462.1 ABC transporter ATP-binding protein [Parvimonas sp. M20]